MTDAYNGPTHGPLCEGWVWWIGLYSPDDGRRRDVNASRRACDTDGKLAFIHPDGLEGADDDVPANVRHALREKWCEMWGWDVRRVPVQSPHSTIRRVDVTKDGAEVTATDWPAPVRHLVLEMLREPAFPGHERTEWGDVVDDQENRCDFVPFMFI